MTPFYFQNAKILKSYGPTFDPLGIFDKSERVYHNWLYTIQYFRNFNFGKRRTLSIGSGFLISREKQVNPYYTVDNPNNPTMVGVEQKSFQWSDPGIHLTLKYNWAINKNLRLGLNFNTAYILHLGVQYMSLGGEVIIPFGNAMKK